MNRNRLQLLAGVVVALVLSITFGYIAHLQRSNAALALRAYNDSAAADSSRSMALSRRDSLRILGDSLGGVTRLVVQRTQERDQLDRALGQRPTANVTLTLNMPQLRATSIVSSLPVLVDSQDTRHAAFHVEQGAYTAQVGVSLPAAGAGLLDSLQVNVKPAHLRVRIGCQDRNSDGVRPARVTATGPEWLPIFIDHAEQDASVCQGAAAKGFSWCQRICAPFAGQLYLGLGASINPLPMIQGKPAQITPAVQLGVSFFHVPLRLPWP